MTQEQHIKETRTFENANEKIIQRTLKWIYRLVETTKLMTRTDNLNSLVHTILTSSLVHFGDVFHLDAEATNALKCLRFYRDSPNHFCNILRDASDASG